MTGEAMSKLGRKVKIYAVQSELEECRARLKRAEQTETFTRKVVLLNFKHDVEA